MTYIYCGYCGKVVMHLFDPAGAPPFPKEMVNSGVCGDPECTAKEREVRTRLKQCWDCNHLILGNATPPVCEIHGSFDTTGYGVFTLLSTSVCHGEDWEDGWRIR